MSWRRVRARPASCPRARASASGRQPSREASQPQNSTAEATESARWRTVTAEMAPSARRSAGGSKAAATRSRHGVERSHARSTT